MRNYKSIWQVLALGSLFFGVGTAGAQAKGFTLNRYEPTTAGEWSFWVDHPWYSRTRYFAAGVTMNYAHNPLVFGFRDANGNFTSTASVVEHQLLGHVDIAGSFLDRVTLSGSLPITLLERGTPAGGVSPLGGVAVGDPRLGLMIRVVGQPDESPISFHIGGQVWIPIGNDANHQGESGVRVLPKLVLAGLGHRIRWSAVAGFLYRPGASLGGSTATGGVAGSEFQFGTSIYYADVVRRFAIGPEAVLASVVTDSHFFSKDFTSLELLGAFHYNIARQVQLGAAGGVGLLRSPGTPDFRVLFRLAYAPIRKLRPKAPADRDGDGIPDASDACPDVKGVASSKPDLNGCPDRDRDGVFDRDDRCPDVAQGTHPDQDRPGCPLKDTDGDGVYDNEDRCIEVPAGPHPDSRKLGCPATDTDGDGVFDPEDQCPDIAQGLQPDPARLGCPIPDRDGDTVPDEVDACPDKPGAPNPDPKKNGCPGLVQVKNGMLVILQPVFFATGKAAVLAKSFPVLQAVADVMKAQPFIKRIGIEGHTDNVGKPDRNTALSDRRAKSVMQWLIAHGIDAERLEAKGFGPSKPIASNKRSAGRAANRRVEFHIVDSGSTQLEGTP